MDTPSSPIIGSGEGSVGLDDFAHLHLHSQYSLLDGAIRTKDLCKTVKERGMHTVAVTDHGNMFGAVQFYEEAKKWGVKPILGCEAYISHGPMEVKKDRKNYHIVLLARNNEGFANLQRLVSFGYLRGFYYNPRIDRAVLKEHSKGLIGLSVGNARNTEASETDRGTQTGSAVLAGFVWLKRHRPDDLRKTQVSQDERSTLFRPIAGWVTGNGSFYALQKQQGVR